MFDVRPMKEDVVAISKRLNIIPTFRFMNIWDLNLFIQLRSPMEVILLRYFHKNWVPDILDLLYVERTTAGQNPIDTEGNFMYSIAPQDQ